MGVIMQGVFAKMTEEEYREHPALNYSKIATFHSNPEKMGFDMGPKGFFETGKAFEMILQDVVTGSTLFRDRYYVVNVPEVPDKILKWLESGEDLKDKYILKKDGDRNNRYKSLHAMLDLCHQIPLGKIPFTQFDFDNICCMVDNMLNMRVYGYNFKELLQKTGAQFQTPVFWIDEFGIQKKALLDIMIPTDEKTYCIDIKTAATKANFMKFFRNKYWVQDIHYTEGIVSAISDSLPMLFLVAYNDTQLVQPIKTDKDSRLHAVEKYKTLVSDFIKWEESGSEIVSELDFERIKLYF